MKAVRIHSYGDAGALKYEDAPIPTIAPDEVLIKVHSASVNPVDCQYRAGWYQANINYPMPRILGRDVAGHIDRLGSAVKGFEVGDAVFAMTDMGRLGCYAEYAVSEAGAIALAPSSIPLEQAAGVPLASMTAAVALFEGGGLQAGQSVLIHAASGGVGTFAVQLAKNAGARVIATASGANRELVKSLGADEIIDYRNADFSASVRNVDMVLDAMGGEVQEKSWGVLRKGGILVSIRPPVVDDSVPARHGMRYKLASVSGSAERWLKKIAAMIDAGKLRVVIDREFPLAQAGAAHELSESGRARGKIILRVS